LSRFRASSSPRRAASISAAGTGCSRRPATRFSISASMPCGTAEELALPLRLKT